VTLRHRLHRVLYVPLDDRPYNLRAPRLLANMVDYEISVPPVETLGRFRTPGKPDELAGWLRGQVASIVDCMVLSVDMLVYGGLWASRTSGTRTQLALQRLGILHDLREACPDATIYAFATLPRLGTLTSSDEAAQYLESLMQYSVLAGRVGDDAELAEQLQALERQIPASVLGEYLAVRERNEQVNLRVVEHLQRQDIDFLACAQDTSAQDGVHLREQQTLRAELDGLDIADRAAIVSGADQMGMCLLARFVQSHMGKSSTVLIQMPKGSDASAAAEGEDRPFIESIREHLELVGAREAAPDERYPDVVLAVNPPAEYPRADLAHAQVARAHRERARKFVADATKRAGGRGLAVCDAAFTDGADDIFVQELVSVTPELPKLLSYAGWNSASNSLGSALAHAVMRIISLQDKGAFDLVRLLGDISPMRYLALLDSLIVSEKAHIRLLMHRFADDWLYQARVRPRLFEHIYEGLKSGVFDLSQSHRQAETLMRDELTQLVTDLWIDQFLGRHCVLIGSDLAGDEQSELVLADLEETRLSLPWRRLFEIDLDLEFGVQLVAAGSREQ